MVGRASNLHDAIRAPPCTQQNNGLRCNDWHWFHYVNCRGIRMISCQSQDNACCIFLAHLYQITVVQLTGMCERGRQTLNIKSNFLGRLHNQKEVGWAPLECLQFGTMQIMSAVSCVQLCCTTYKITCRWNQIETDNNGRHSPVPPVDGINADCSDN